MGLVNNKVLFVGFRGAAVQSAQAMGLSVVLWSPNPVASRYKPCLQWQIQEPFEDSLLKPPLENQLLQYSPSNVLALTEKSVLLAARIRESLKLPGMSYGDALHCRDKILMKKRAQEHGLTVANHHLINSATTTEELINHLGFPMVLKQRASSGSRGLRILKTPSDIKIDQQIDLIAESFITGQEISTELFVSGGEILFQNITEYYEPLLINIVPARLSDTLVGQVKALAEKVVKAFHIEKGLVHLEAFLTPNGPIFGELAVRPPGGYLMNLIELSYGFNPWQAWFDLEAGKPFHFPQKAKHLTAVSVLHPGAGRITDIHGIEKLRLLPEVVDVRLKKQVGQMVGSREGSGIDIGRILFRAESYDQLIGAIEFAKKTLTIKM